VRLSALLYFYRRRLRTRPIQELLAGVGIAVGVALAFAVQAADSSIVASSRQIVRSVTGAASLQLEARDQRGFDEGVLASVRRLPGVVRAAPTLEEHASMVGAGGAATTVNLIGVDPSLLSLGGALTSDFGVGELLIAHGIVVSSSVAHRLDLGSTLGRLPSAPGPANVSLRLRGRASPIVVVGALGPETIGPLADADIALVWLPHLQQLAGLPRRVTRILIKTAPGAQARVAAELRALAGGRLTVVPAENDVRLLARAIGPNDQMTSFFTVISVLVGALIAFNAMLLTVPERRRVIADLRIQGARPWQLVEMLLFQALCLGFVASLVGVAVGELLARTLFHLTPGYIALAFPTGAQTVIGWQPLVLAVLGGVLITCLAAGTPLLDLRRGRAVDAVYREGGQPGHALGGRARLWMLGAAGILTVTTTALLLVSTSLVIVAIGGLALATMLAVPALFAGVLRGAELVADNSARLTLLALATRALRATTLRSLALAATGAIAVFGAVAVEGARSDLFRGLSEAYSQYVGTADLWIANSGDTPTIEDFRAGDLQARVERVPGVAAVRAYYGGLLDLADRRVWVIARSPAASAMIPASQLVAGDLASATARLRMGGWIAISQQIASAGHLRPGDALVLPTPTGGVSYRIAATTTNLGWSSGAIVLNSADYRRAWPSAAPSALEVDVRPGAAVAAVQRAIRRALGPGVGLQVQTAGERATEVNAIVGQGLSQVTQIATLLLIAAVLAMAAAMWAAIWQRRPSLASLRVQSFQPGQLRRVLLAESAIVLGTGCLIGALAGIYGHFLTDRWLRLSTGYPAPFVAGSWGTVEIFAAVLAVALAILTVPGYIASRVPPGMALQE